jgi:hypothetical protein
MQSSKRRAPWPTRLRPIVTSMSSRIQYVVVETLISVAINTALSVGFVFLVFHGQSQIPPTGRRGSAADMAPQTFMVVLMSCFVPGLLTRRRLLAGTLSWHEAKGNALLSKVWLAAAILALLATCLAVAVSWSILPYLLPSEITFRSLAIGKALFGMLLGAIVTPWAIAGVLRVSHFEEKRIGIYDSCHAGTLC